ADAGGQHVWGGEGVSDVGRSADMAQVAVREQQLRQAVHALSSQERFYDELRGRFIAAINQQIIPASGGIGVNRITAAERKNRDARVISMMVPQKETGCAEQTECNR